MKFEVNFTFLTKPFFYMTKKSRQFKYLENEISFLGEIKIIYNFKGLIQLPKIVSDLRMCL